ncbi:hypothetical protein [Alistipes sp.]|uniref:hypothetical protein n=1 Tax=Alistipes sp. TaxID=1872444 RepID=UPI003AF0AB55
MEKAKKPRKKHVWDSIRKLTRQYEAQVKATHRQIDEYAKKGRIGHVTTPNYVIEVISPLSKALGEQLPHLNITVSEKVELTDGKVGYFRVSTGERVLGGFSYPGPGVSQINFTIFAHDKPWGKALNITKMSQLVKIITELVEFLGPDNANGNDK